MGYRVSIIFRKDDENPWPWCYQDVWTPELTHIRETFAEGHPLYGPMLAAAEGHTDPKEFKVSRDYETAEEANRMLIRSMTLTETEVSLQSAIRGWMLENAGKIGYVNWRTEIVTEEI
jgi:hypothetical protein